jgi:hypothetical protein
MASVLTGPLCPSNVLAQTNASGLPVVSIQALSDATECGPYPGSFSVTRTEPFDQALDVEYQITGTASNAVDYQRLSGRITIPAGQASALIPVAPYDDRIQEALETVVLTLVPRNRPFSLVLLPDTQCYTSASMGGLPEMFTAQTRWIAAHKDEQNIAFVLHEGDVTDHNYWLEWQRGRDWMRLLDGVVPYAVAVGNHDGISSSVSQTALFNQYFSVTNYLGKPGFGGVFESNRMDNCYHLLSAGGIDWLLLVLEFGPRNQVLAWANQVLDNHPDRRVILLTHSHVYSDNTLHGSSTNHLWMPTSYGRANNGVDVWNKLLRLHPNTALAFNGHMLLSGAGRLVGTNDYGSRVFQMLANYQVRADGGGGFLRLVQFQPEQDSMTVTTYSPYLNSWLRDAGNQFTYTNLGMFVGTSPGYLIDPGESAASLVITNDNLNVYPPELVSCSFIGVPPVFKLTFNVPLDSDSALTLSNYALSDGTCLTAAQLSPDQATVFLTAESNLVDGLDYELTAGGLRNLEFGIGMTNAAVWSFSYRSLVMVDDFSAGNVNAYTIIDEGAIDAPSVWFEPPGRLFQESNIYGPNASAMDRRKGTFAVWKAPEALSWSNYAVTVSFRTGDDDGLGLLFRYQNRSNYYKVELDSERHFRKLLRVVGGVETTIAAETNGYTPNQDYQLRVMATNNEIRVRLNGTLLFGGAVLDSSLAAGTFAFYSWGNQGVSFSGLAITPPFRAPHTAILSPAPAAVFNEFDPIPIEVSAFGVDSDIQQVEVLDGTNSIVTFLEPPYYWEWMGAAAGDHTLVVRATDTTGLTGVSEAPIRVAPAYPVPVWREHPKSQAIAAGSGVLFSARALSSWPLSYQWYFNGQPIAAATRRLCFLNAVNPDNGGEYYAIACDRGVCVTSRVAVLSVLEGTNPPVSGPLDSPRLSIAGFDELDTPVLSLEADPRAAVAIEASSTDLTNWLLLLSVTNVGSPFYFSDPAAVGPDLGPRFYRMVQTP